MPLHNLIEYSNIYLKTSRSLWQYYRDKPALENNDGIIDFPPGSNNSIFFNLKDKIIGETESYGTKE